MRSPTGFLRGGIFYRISTEEYFILDFYRRKEVLHFYRVYAGENIYYISIENSSY